MNVLDEIERQVLSWPEVSAHPHRFGGREFRFREAEIGHVHQGGIVDIPFTRAVRDVLLEQGLAEEHHWVPNSGWITYGMRSEDGLRRALWLLHLSYLRYALKAVSDPARLLEDEVEKMQLTPQLKSLLEAFVPKSARHASDQPVPA